MKSVNSNIENFPLLVFSTRLGILAKFSLKFLIPNFINYKRPKIYPTKKDIRTKTLISTPKLFASESTALRIISFIFSKSIL